MTSTKQTSSSITCEHRLFVYGTLAPGKPNEHILADVSGDWQTGTVAGTLFEEGWGAAMGYPGIVLSEQRLGSISDAGIKQSNSSTLEELDDQVTGQVFTSMALPEHWQRLDEFEGDGYQRVATKVQLTNGETVSAYIYTLANQM